MDTFAVVDSKPVDLPTPEVASEPEVKEPEAVAEPETEKATEEPETTEEESAEPAPVEGEQPKHKQTASERVRQAVNEKNAEKEARIRAEAERDLFKAQLEGKTQPQAHAEQDDEPLEEHFETAAEFEEAKKTWRKNNKEKLKAELRAELKAEMRVESRLTEANTKFKDFNTVAGVDSPLATYMQKNPAMADAAWNDGNFAAVSYHLGKNLDEAARISALPPLQAVIEIGKLSERLTRQADVKPPVKVVTSAPDPVKTLNGGGEVEVDESNLSMAEYGKKWLDKKAKGR